MKRLALAGCTRQLVLTCDHTMYVFAGAGVLNSTTGARVAIAAGALTQELQILQELVCRTRSVTYVLRSPHELAQSIPPEAQMLRSRCNAARAGAAITAGTDAMYTTSCSTAIS